MARKQYIAPQLVEFGHLEGIVLQTAPVVSLVTQSLGQIEE